MTRLRQFHGNCMTRQRTTPNRNKIEFELDKLRVNPYLMAL
jgi:hypothetical protein